MTISYSKFFAPVQLPAAVGTLLTVPAAPTTMLLRGGRIRLVNTSASPASATLYAVPSGAAGPAAANAFLSGKTINANDYLDIDVPIMAAGDTLQGLASAATSITAHMIAGSYFA